MSIRLSIYDFFAYTLPGGLILLLVITGFVLFGDLKGEIIWGQITFLNLFLFALPAYLMGFVIDPLSSRWAKLFQANDFPAYAFRLFVARYPHHTILFNLQDWPIWMAKLRRENLNLVVEIDRYMALYKMTRGLSFALILLAIMLAIAAIATSLSLWFLVLAGLAVPFSLLANYTGKKFHRWYYWVIFETILSQQPGFGFEDRNRVNPIKAE